MELIRSMPYLCCKICIVLFVGLVTAKPCLQYIVDHNVALPGGEGRVPTGDLAKLVLLKIAYFSFDEFYKVVGVFSLILTELVSAV
jgi:hypothetical protein